LDKRLTDIIDVHFVKQAFSFAPGVFSGPMVLSQGKTREQSVSFGLWQYLELPRDMARCGRDRKTGDCLLKI